jgi:hypothetical protein
MVEGGQVNPHRQDQVTRLRALHYRQRSQARSLA